MTHAVRGARSNYVII